MWWTVLRAGISKYKWIILLGLFLMYSAGLWHVASGYQKSSYLQEKLSLESKNRELSRDLSKALDNVLTERAAKNETENKEIHEEAKKSFGGADCRISDGLRDNLNNKLNRSRRDPPKEVP